MGDHRIALKGGTILHLRNKTGEKLNFVIEDEIGCGGSCIVYEASRIADTGNKSLYRIKELYPYKLNILRDKNDNLIPSAKDSKAFECEKRNFRRDFSRTSQLFYSEDNYASMTNQMDMFCENGTCYTISAYSSRKNLKNYQPDSLKECIQLVIRVAYVIGKIHKQGYLYLDTKPENVLVIDGYKKQIQLFDFDSLLPVNEIKMIKNGEIEAFRISYSKGFSAFELQSGNAGSLGEYTDVYGVGALLFYLLFGKTPKAPDCEMDAEYDFSDIKFDHEKCDDRLFSSLTGFFRKSLAVYYADRYQSMAEMLEKLELIEKYADTTVPRIFSTSYYQIAPPKTFFGRKNELASLDELMNQPDHNCIFVTGIGGIGKSSLVKRYLCSRKEQFDIMLFVDYKGSMEETITDDRNIEINTLRWEDSGRSSKEYFEKKLVRIRDLIRDKNAVLVIDNFTGEADEDLKAVISTGIKLILISRRSAVYQSCGEIKLEAISDRVSLRRIFERNLGRAIKEDERDGFENILCEIQGHTLLLELIAKQIAGSHITISDAAELTGERGFTEIAPEKIVFEKDNIREKNTIGNIIDALFEADGLSAEKKSLMKIMSLTGDRGIDINELQGRLKLMSKDDVNELINDGWIMLKGDSVSLHHVIKEAVHRWKWNAQYIKVAEGFLTSFYKEIRMEAEKNNCPLRLRKEGIDYSKPADIKRLHEVILQCEDILEQCKKEKSLKNLAAYIKLCYVTLINAPVHQEEYRLNGAIELFKKFASAEKILTDKVNRRRLEDWHIMLYHDAALICADRWDFEAARELIDEAWAFAKKVNRNKIYALYYDMLGSYYDIVLNGAYVPVTKEEKIIFEKMVKADEKTLRYSKKGVAYDADHLYAENLVARAVFMIRNGKASPRKIKAVLKKAEDVIMENTGRFADVRFHYCLACATYFSRVCMDLDGTRRSLEVAWELAEPITFTDMQRIENLVIPSGHAFFELGEYETSLKILKYGIRLCEKYPESDVYTRLKGELYDHQEEADERIVQ